MLHPIDLLETTLGVHAVNTTEEAAPYNATLLTVPAGYLVYSKDCKIVSLDPMAKDVMRLFSREKNLTCSTKPPFTTVERQNGTGRFLLKVVDVAKKKRSYRLDKCSVRMVTRMTENQIR